MVLSCAAGLQPIMSCLLVTLTPFGNSGCIDLQLLTNLLGVDMFARTGLAANDTALIGAAGLKGAPALTYLNSTPALSNITLTREQQYLMFLDIYHQHAVRTSPLTARSRSASDLYARFILQPNGTSWSNLDTSVQDILVDLQYRGDFTRLSAGNSRADTAAVTARFRDAINQNNPAALCRVFLESFTTGPYVGQNVWRTERNNNNTPGNSADDYGGWGVPDVRHVQRIESLGGTYDWRNNVGTCPP